MTIDFVKVGQVVSFHYVQPLMGENDRYGKILHIRPFSKTQLEKLNSRSEYRRYELFKGTFNRSFALLTVEHTNGSIRQYYNWRLVLTAKNSLWGFRIRKFFRKMIG